MGTREGTAWYTGRMAGTFLGHCSDILVRLEQVTTDAYQRELKAHLLLFDSIEIPVTQVLSNPVLSGLLRSHKVAEACLRRDDQGVAPLQGVSFGYQSFVEIAEAMRDNKTVHGHESYDALIAHARNLDDFSAPLPGRQRFETIEQHGFRRHFFELATETYAAMMNSPTAHGWSNGDAAFANDLRQWIRTSFPDRTRFEISPVWNHVLSSGVERHKRMMRPLDASYQFAFATKRAPSSETLRLSSPHDYLKAITAVTNTIPIENDAISRAEIAYSFTSILEFVDVLDLDDVVALRPKPPLPELRKRINEFAADRADEETAAEISETLKKTTKPLMELAATKNHAMRRSILATLKKDERKTKIRVWRTNTGRCLYVLVDSILAATLDPNWILAIVGLDVLLPREPNTTNVSPLAAGFMRRLEMKEAG